jgi:hypothetical protein
VIAEADRICDALAITVPALLGHAGIFPAADTVLAPALDVRQY